MVPAGLVGLIVDVTEGRALVRTIVDPESPVGITVKSKGEVTLVGPFRAGKNEGPCQSFAFEVGGTSGAQDDGELESALGDFLERFLEEAAAP